MINILIPLGGTSPFFDPTLYPFPKPLIEVAQKPMIQIVIDQFTRLKKEHKFVFVVPVSDCQKFYLDDTLSLLTNGNCKIIRRPDETAGAACSALLAIEEINNDSELIISNGDQFVEMDMNKMLDQFNKNKADAGVPTFDSVHPKWSYVRMNKEGWVAETAEKRPISRRAIAGTYWFKQGRDFVDSAMDSIRKDSSVNGAYYIAPCLNELILKGKRVVAESIAPGRYYSFYSPQKIEEFETAMSTRTDSHETLRAPEL